MISWARTLAAILLATCLGLVAYYVIFVPLPLAIFYATASSSSGWDRGVVRIRIRALQACPQGSDFSPAGPLIYLLSNMHRESVDVVQTQTLFRDFVRLGCDINAVNESGIRPIHAAILFRDPASLKLVIDLGADQHLKTGPEVRYSSGLSNLDASAYLAKLCVTNNAKCDEIRAILVAAER